MSERCIHCGVPIQLDWPTPGEWAHASGSRYCQTRNGFTATPLRVATPRSEMQMPIEKTISYATTVPDLEHAWAFVMSCLDRVGPDPDIHIRPVQTAAYDADLRQGESWVRLFEVAVSGMVEEKDPEVEGVLSD